jgi:putative aldouronate transport system substrate-binding protein
MRNLSMGVIFFLIPIFSIVAGAGQQQRGTVTNGPAKISYYSQLGNAAQVMKSFSEHPGWREVQKRLNIEIDFRSPAAGNETEQFNLMVASRDFTDIIVYGWLNVPGGPAGYIRDDVIIPLNDVIDKWAPDLKNTFKKFPIAKREATLDDGTLYVFPQLYSNASLASWYGPIFRRDLLERVPGLDASQFPNSMETLEEWEKILLTVKNSGLKSDSGHDIIPLSFSFDGNYHNSGLIIGAWGISTRFTQENGIPVYGPVDPRYREYLTLMKRWYDLGILDREFAANVTRVMQEKILDNRVFATAGSMGSYVTNFTELARPRNPAFTFNTTKYPVLKKGEQPALGFRTFDFAGSGAAISTACKNIESAARLLNYDYSDEGYILMNFGIEGETFNWDTGIPYTTDLIVGTHRGYPRYTDLIVNNPNFSRDTTGSAYIRGGNYYGVKSGEYLEQRDSLPEQNGPNGRALWMASLNKIKVPAVTPTQEESAEFSRIMNGINTYVDEMTVKFIMGVEPLSKFDEFVATQKRMGIDRALEIMRDQIDRYNKRP